MVTSGLCSTVRLPQLGKATAKGGTSKAPGPHPARRCIAVNVRAVSFLDADLYNQAERLGALMRKQSMQ